MLHALLKILPILYKLKDSVSLESGCGTWNRLLLGCNPGQFSFILRAASDTLPTAMNLPHCHSKCVLRMWGYSIYYSTHSGWWSHHFDTHIQTQPSSEFCHRPICRNHVLFFDIQLYRKMYCMFYQNFLSLLFQLTVNRWASELHMFITSLGA